MNFLDLCKKVSLKADLTSGLTTTINQIGILGKIVDWVVDAYDEIQGSEQWWLFQLRRDSASITAGIKSYDAFTFLPLNFDFMWEKTIAYSLTGSQAGKIEFISWDLYMGLYLHAELSTERPTQMAIDPTGKVYFNTVPDKDYTIEFEYQIKLEHFSQNSDIPVIPGDFHDLIWRLALIKYGEHYGAQEVTMPAQHYFEDRMQVMKNRYLPKMSFAENVYNGYNQT